MVIGAGQREVWGRGEKKAAGQAGGERVHRLDEGGREGGRRWVKQKGIGLYVHRH